VGIALILGLGEMDADTRITLVEHWGLLAALGRAGGSTEKAQDRRLNMSIFL
jgi:hypothetical protein